MVVVFSYDGVITALSPLAEQAMGYSATELVGRPITKVLAEPSVFDIHRIMEAALDCGSWEGEVVHLSRGGEALAAHSRVLSLSRAASTKSDFLLISTRTGASGATAAEAGALEAQSSRLRSLAHEINNPLAVVMGFTQLILLNPQCSGKVRADVERLYSELGRVARVVERLHRYAVSLRQDQGSAQSAAG